MQTAAKAIDWSERGLIPDAMIRAGIRRLLNERLKQLAADDTALEQEIEQAFVKLMDGSPLALTPEKANEQHYEVPASFYGYILGQQRKYSCAYWPENTTTLDEAESQALALTCERAGLEDGMQILELGCGWGSLTLWMAEHYPNAQITAVSNSASQKEFITYRANARRFSNIEVITADMNHFSTDVKFDRVISVEMFEHMRNYRQLYESVYHWLKPGGRFFKHIFVHRGAPYAFEDDGDEDWMSRYFFSGGMMPSDSLPLYFQDHVKLIRRWRWDGIHYEKTCNAWLVNMDTHKDALLAIIAEVYGVENTQTWWMRWRMFFMACAELFGFEQGQRWMVGHYLFERPLQEQSAL